MFGDPEIRIALDQQDFEALVQGHEVTKFGTDHVKVRIILSDIGYPLMLAIIRSKL